MSFNNDKLLNLIRSQAMGIMSQFSNLRVAQVSSYDPINYSAQVIIQPENMLTGWLPILTPWMGDSWGFYAPPSPGDSVVIHFMEGSLSVGFVGERLFTKIDRPISSGPDSGELWMVHKTGTFLKFKNDGTIAITCLDINGDPTNLTIHGNVVVTGNITSTGDILDNSGTNHNTVKNMRTIYDGHTHGGVSAGGANTLDPNQPM